MFGKKKEDKNKLFLTADEKLVLEKKRELVYQSQYLANLVDRDAQMFLHGEVFKRLGLDANANAEVFLEDGYIALKEPNKKEEDVSKEK